MASNSFLGDIAYEAMIRGQVGLEYQQRIRDLESQLDNQNNSNGLLMAELLTRMDEKELEGRDLARERYERLRAEAKAKEEAERRARGEAAPQEQKPKSAPQKPVKPAQPSSTAEHQRAETWRRHYNEEREKVDDMLKERIAGAEHATARYRQRNRLIREGKAKERETQAETEQIQREMSDTIARKEDRIDELGDMVRSVRRDLRTTKDTLAEQRGSSAVYRSPLAPDEYAEARDALVRVKRYADSYEQLNAQNMPDWVTDEYNWCKEHDELVDRSAYQAEGRSVSDTQRNDMFTALGEAVAHSSRINDEKKRSVMDAAVGRARESLANLDRRIDDMHKKAMSDMQNRQAASTEQDVASESETYSVDYSDEFIRQRDAALGIGGSASNPGNDQGPEL